MAKATTPTSTSNEALRRAFAERLITPSPLCGEQESIHAREMARRYAEMAQRFGKAAYREDAERFRRRAQKAENDRRFWLANQAQTKRFFAAP